MIHSSRYGRLRLVSALLGCALLASCTVDRSVNPAYRGCDDDDECDLGQRCHGGYCVPDADGTRDPAIESPLHGERERDASAAGASSNGAAGRSQGGAQSSAPVDAQSRPGSPPSAGESGGGGGQSGGGGESAGAGVGDPPPVEPPVEEPVGACATGAQPSPESCNGEDDDCDGTSDELPVTTCYPGTAGCSDPEGDGTLACMGACKAGIRSCSGGREECTGAVMPATESCTEAGVLAEDEDCDGRADEGCACVGDAAQPCFDGPRQAIGVGRCRAGTQTCADGAWSTCTGARLPETETCANPGQDDDCNGMRDDIPRLGGECTADHQGRCREGRQQCASGALTCVPAAPAAETCDRSDEDCDGKVDEDFSLKNDPANCGACGHVCSGLLQACCAGVCKTLCLL
jgi:hypothetical protein